jgi:uncharacterized protein
MQENSSTKSISNSHRISELDVLRGFALLGIFMVNILGMNCGFTFYNDWTQEQTGFINQSSLFIINTFFHSKFFPIFSLLFGVGIALQIERLKNKDHKQLFFFIKRFGSLFLFGVFHILFIWSGDILHLYAVIGFAIFILYKCSTKFLLWSSVIIFLFPYYGLIADNILSYFEFDNMSYLNSISRETLVELKREGSFVSGIELRIKEYLFIVGLMFSSLFPFAASMAILGAYLVKKGALNNLYEFIYKIRVPFLSTTFILITYRFVFLYGIRPNFELEEDSIITMILINLFILADMAIALLYVWLIIYAYHSSLGKKILFNFSFAGKMAFTNYILQSIIGYFLMRSISLYETLTPTTAILITIIVFIAQVFLSKIWLSRFKLGPLEWLWRCISYGKILPIKIKAYNTVYSK